MKISVVVPVYNVEKYLFRCLESLKNQTYKNFEAIFIVDKCTDNSESIVDKYVSENDNFKKFYYEHTGLATARNLGVKEVSGDYILFLDSDDFLENDCLEVLVDSLNDSPDLLRFQVQDVLGENILEHKEDPFDVMSGTEAFERIIRYHYVENAWCYCYKTSFYIENNFKYMDGCIAEDFGLTPIVIAKAKSVKSISYIGYNYVQREGSLMSNNDYTKKLKKMTDMLVQADNLKSQFSSIKDSNRFLFFINNSLIHYHTTLRYKDYRKYNKILKNKGCFDTLIPKNLKQRIKFFLIKRSAWFFYHYMVR